MKQTEQKTGMPLFLWLVSVLVATGFLVSAFFLLQFRDKELGIKGVQNVTVTQYTNAGNDSLDGYFLGTSLTSCALIQYRALDSLIRIRKEKFRYKFLIAPGATLKDYNYTIDEIRRLRPKCLFIESNTACVDMSGQDSWSMINFRIRMARVPVYLFGMGFNALHLFKSYVPADFAERHRKKIYLDEQNLLDDFEVGKRFRVRDPGEFPLWENFFKEAGSLGIKIYFLDLPRSMEAEHGLPRKFSEKFKTHIATYNKQYHIEYIHFPIPLRREAYFIDRAHFNRSGSKIYSMWLTHEFETRKIITRR